MWKRKLGVAICALVMVSALYSLYSTMGRRGPEETETGMADQAKNASSSAKVEITDVVVGTGAEAVNGKVLAVHYTGRLQNGTKFDSSLDRGTPFEFRLGAHHVISGWEEGIAGMKVGGKRTLVIPPSMGYGASGTPDGTIPPNATLVFDVELVRVR